VADACGVVGFRRTKEIVWFSPAPMGVVESGSFFSLIVRVPELVCQIAVVCKVLSPVSADDDSSTDDDTGKTSLVRVVAPMSPVIVKPPPKHLW